MSFIKCGIWSLGPAVTFSNRMENDMNNHIFDIVMIAIMVPAALIVFLYEYPKKWKDRKLIFGVRNREEFKNIGTAEKVDEITGSCRKQAGLILIVSLIILGLMCLIPDFTLRMVVFSIFVMVDIVILVIPFARGNGEMKSLKKEIGLVSKGLSYTDFTNAGSVHALKVSRLIIPNIIGGIVCFAALLYDLKLYSVAGRTSSGDYLTSGMMAAFLIIGLMLIPVGLLFDKMRNEVISDDSDINANYNRAKKKNWADTNSFMVWINTAFIAISFPLMVLFNSEMIYMIMVIIYMLLLFVGIGLFIKRNLAIEKRYRRETSIEVDDDDCWILGSIYYNPEDKRLNVEKRAGVGATINMAHPVGKFIGAVAVLAIIGTFIVLIWVAILSKTPISVRVEDGKLICHQMKDDYVIPVDSIEEVTLGEGSRNLKMSRISGYDIEPVEKGKYTVEGESGCIVFISYDADKYIRFTSNGKTYYISSGTAEETENIYGQIQK
jgi:Predicted membrane protein